MFYGNANSTNVYGASLTQSNSWGGSMGGLASGSVCSVSETGSYKIEVYGGNGSGYSNAGGGHIIATTKLKKGDILKVVFLEGGTAPSADKYGNGGGASILYLNDSPLVGAGGRGGQSWYFQRGSTVTETYYPAEPVVSINNALFSSGGGGGTNGNVYGYHEGSNGNTISGCTPASGGAYNSGGVSGCNYLDTSRAVLVSQPNDNASNVASFSVVPQPLTQAESYSVMASSLQTMAEKFSSGSLGGSTKTEVVLLAESSYPTVEVVQNVSFDLTLGYYDDMQSGQTSDGKVKVVNSTIGDKVIKLQGKMTEVGLFQVTIKGKVFNIKVIASPNATNTTVRLE